MERNVAFEKGKEKWAFVLIANLYNRLDDDKVITEASVRSGLPKPVINAAWGSIGDVIRAWTTEGHSVAIPGLGSLRFGLNSQSVSDVNKVSADLINRRYIIFTPSTLIKKELYDTSISITCYDRTGKVVKQVTSTDDPSNEPDGGGSSNPGSDSGSSTPDSNPGSEGDGGEDVEF